MAAADFPSWLTLDSQDRNEETLQSELYRKFRSAILNNQLKANTRLPSSRRAAAELGVSRTTVIATYEQLKLEGFIEGRHGSGMIVRELGNNEVRSTRSGTDVAKLELSRRGREIVQTDSTSLLTFTRPVPFRLGVPDSSSFPIAEWRRITARQWQKQRWNLLSYSNTQGLPALREELARYLGLTRGVICEPDQIVIVAGTQQGVRLVAELLLDRGDRIWVENPGYLAVRGAFRALGATVDPVPVDEEGIDIAWGDRNLRTPKMVYVTPSHQYPLGMTMSIQRRLALIEWATDNNATIIEDDFNSEFRYGARAITSLQGLAPPGRVLYVGTFTKLLFAGMRLGYVVVPKDLVRPLVYARSMMGTHSISDHQAILAEFIGTSGLDRHVRRMRTLYGDRKQALEKAIEERFPRGWRIVPASAGMHLVAIGPRSINDVALAKRALAAGVEVTALSRFYHPMSESLGQRIEKGLILGFSGYEVSLIRKSVEKLSKIISI